MCSIWLEKDSPFLSLEQIEQILQNNDFSFIRFLTLTGGEPTLRNDLVQVFQLFIKYLPNLEEVHMATSGLNTRRTLQYLAEMMDHLEMTQNKVKRFTVQVSLDGVGEIHDKIRGISGFFDKTYQTLMGIQALRTTNRRLNLHLSSVLMPENISHVEEVREFARKHQLGIHFSPVVLASEYYNNLHGMDFLPLMSNTTQDTARQFFETLSREDPSSLRYYYRDMVGMMGGDRRKRRCMMGFYAFVLEHDGSIYPCVNCERKSFGNLLSQTFEEIWFDNESESVRGHLRSECCPTCTSMCYTLPVNTLEVAGVIWHQKIKPVFLNNVHGSAELKNPDQ